MKGSEPCVCSSDKVTVRKIKIGGSNIGIAQLDQIINEVYELDLGEEEAADQLLKRVKVFNYVPPNAEEEYRRSLIKEYGRARP